MSILKYARVAAMILGAASASSVARAQTPEAAAFTRARQLVVNGNSAAGRLVIDSIISATPTDSPLYGDALYWRAALAASSGDAETDYRRLLIDYPLSSHLGDAQLALADLENARGDKTSAASHLGQFLSDNPGRPERPRATLLYVRLLLEQNQLPRGCTALKQTISEIPDSLVETRNQLEYYLPRCAANDVSVGGAAPVGAASAKAATRGSERKPGVPTVSPRARYTLQVAAYKTLSDAEALVKRLKARKIDDVRVVSTETLHRVRIGHYVTKEGAVAAQRDLKAKKIDAVVTDAESTPK